MNKYYYEYKDDGDVKYCYPGTQVLVNKFDIHNGQQLSKVEREISIVKAAAFMCNYEKMEGLIRKCVKEMD